jgi:hypothetical protein
MVSVFDAVMTKHRVIGGPQQPGLDDLPCFRIDLLRNLKTGERRL